MKTIENKIWDAARTLRNCIAPIEYCYVITQMLYIRQNCDSLQWENIERSNDIKNTLNIEIEKLQNDLPKGVLSSINPKIENNTLKKLIQVFSKIDVNQENIYGYIYEYCLDKFSKNSGKKGGEFYTPSSILSLILDMFYLVDGDILYDPCCGCGGVFVEANKRAEIKCYGQEINADTWGLAQLTAKLNNISVDFGYKPQDIFKEDLHKDIKADYIISNPPFNQSIWNMEGNEYLWTYGKPPHNNANYAWIEQMLYHLKENGKIALVLTNSTLTYNRNMKKEHQIRKNLIDAGLVESIITFPTHMFYNTNISFCVWILSKKKNDKILFIDASQKYDKDKIVNLYYTFKNGINITEKNYAKSIPVSDVIDNDYSLFPADYIYNQYYEKQNVYKLKDLTKFRYGHKISANGKTYPIYGSSGVIGYTNDEPKYNGPAIIIGRKGNINSVYYETGKFECTDVTFYCSSFSELVMPKYLYYKLKSIDFNVYDSGCGIPSLKKKNLDNINILLPDLKDQTKIIKKFEKMEQRYEEALNQAQLLKDKIDEQLKEL